MKDREGVQWGRVTEVSQMRKLYVGLFHDSCSSRTPCPMYWTTPEKMSPHALLIHQEFEQEEMKDPSTFSQLVLKDHLFYLLA